MRSSKKRLTFLVPLIYLCLVYAALDPLPQIGHAVQTLPAVLTRFPYIQSPTTTSVTIIWQTHVASTGEVEYGKTLDLDRAVKDTVTSLTHVVTLDNLEPNTLYYYRVKGNGVPLTEPVPFRTNKDKTEKNFSFVVFGDSGSGDDNQRRVAKVMEGLNFDLALITGDVVYESGRAENYDPNYFIPYQKLIRSIPFFPSLGNHDIKTGNGKPYLDAFYLPANNPQQTERYYSFSYANAYFIALDSNDKDLYLPDSDHKNHGTCQYNWLKDHLSHVAQDKDIFWRFVFFHHPPYSAGYHGAKAELMRLRKTLSPLFETYGVQMVFTGHDHNYERAFPIKGGEPLKDGPPQEGVVYIVTGGGGRGQESWKFWRTVRSDRPWTAYIEKAYHVTYVEIQGTTLKLQAIRDDGQVMDSVTYTYPPRQETKVSQGLK